MKSEEQERKSDPSERNRLVDEYHVVLSKVSFMRESSMGM